MTKLLQGVIYVAAYLLLVAVVEVDTWLRNGEEL